MNVVLFTYQIIRYVNYGEISMINNKELKEKIESEFSRVYTHFKGFKDDEVNRKYWDKCMEAVTNPELLSHIIFCNDLFQIPPAKTFFIYYKDYFIQFVTDKNMGLDAGIKKSIGAFWGFVFKFALGYTEQKNIYVGIKGLKVSTATYFINNQMREKGWLG